MKLKHWVLTAFVVIGIIATYHYAVQHRGVSLSGMVGANGTKFAANAGVGG